MQPPCSSYRCQCSGHADVKITAAVKGEYTAYLSDKIADVTPAIVIIILIPIVIVTIVITGKLDTIDMITVCRPFHFHGSGGMDEQHK